MKLYNPTNSDITGFWQRYNLPAGGTLELKEDLAKEMLRTFPFLEVAQEITEEPKEIVEQLVGEVLLQEEQPTQSKRGRKKTK